MGHYNRFIPELPVQDPKAIPQAWRQYKRQDVDVPTRKNAVRDGMDAWIAWEHDTKSVYENSAKELFNIGDVSAARFAEGYAEESGNELKTAVKDFLSKKASDFDMALIAGEQKMIHDKCRKKMRKIF